VTEAIVHVVDDDDAIRDALAWLFRSRALPARTWASGEAFLAAAPEGMRGCVVLDVRMNGMSGVDVQDELGRRGCRMPIIFLTAHADVPLAVTALKNGAFDFVEKPFNDNQLVDRVIQAMRSEDAMRQEAEEQARISAHLATLTQREREVMERILAGDYNKTIAESLSIAVRTVEVHRARVFEKMGVQSAVELARLLARPR
jgi:two-component system response regulator DctR